MGERKHNVTTSNTRWAFASLAAALFVLAGSAHAVAQTSGSKKTSTKPPSSTPAAPPATNLAPPLPSGGPTGGKSGGPGKLIRQAGEDEGNKKLEGEKVKVDDHLIVDLHVNDEDLANVLQMLSIQAQRNI